ncbi:peptidylprolyl isomerase [Cyclobacterium amurskyense]|uniref:peptidylprolyl isomerase n=1 Tax=Cyclobacterium amurskyense TaxID=320787 RepID=UPI0030D70C1D|tara:strand:- start:2353 stop:4326 length:1974 start_codon:yes stop_codon:yes gene_type:complete
MLGILFASATPVPDPIKEANPPLDYLLKIDGETSDREEFLYILNKNRQKDAAPISRTEFEENFELFVDYKLKVKYAMDLGMHKTKAFSDEFSAFKDQLKKPYLLENSLTEGELRKAYSRMQEIVKASHILFQFPQNASKEDSIAVFKMAEKIKAEAEAGEDFHQLAVQHSDDPSASSNKGSLGYFTALQMVLPFEEAAYNLKVGEISSPIISDFGYHIIKLEDRRPNPGQLHVSHLLIRSAGAEEDQMAFNKINQIHQNLIENPSQWLELVKTYSEDPGSKANKGMIPWFGVGSIVPEFEHAAFSLSKKGDFSAPVKTEYGYHIIRLEGAKPVPPFNEVLPTIKSNILRDSRSNLIKDQVLAMQKAKFNVTENSQLINSLKNAFSSSSGRPVAQLYIKLEGLSNKGDKLIVRSEWKDATIQDFIAYLKKEGPSVNTLLNASFDEVYGDYLENLLATWEEEHLYQNNKDYRQLVNEYKNGMLLFELMNNEVWQKALEDSTGQRNYFQNNTDNYMWSKRVKALIVKAIKSQNISKVESWLSTKTLTDSLSTELKNRFLEKNTLLFTVEQKTFEVDNNELLSELDLNQTFHKLHQNEETVLIVLGETLPARQKKYEETRGRLIQDYQQYLETKLITELKQKYTIQVNEDEKEKIYQSLAK